MSGIGHGPGGESPQVHSSCFLVESEGARVLLDFGGGVTPEILAEINRGGRIDAVILSHGHWDHAGGLHLLPQIGNPPVFGTPPVLLGLPDIVDKRPLLLGSNNDIADLPLTIGRSGHTAGGVWIHLDEGGGLLYMGDSTMESPIYPFDQPPPARLAIVDASYGVYDTSLKEQIATFDTMLDEITILFPVTSVGRGPEIAFHLFHNRGVFPILCPIVREEILSYDTPWVKEGTMLALNQLKRSSSSFENSRLRYFVANNPSANGGESAALIERFEETSGFSVIFTGFKLIGQTAERLKEKAIGRGVRWNTHPALSENTALIRSTGTEVVIPAYASATTLPSWRRAFFPAHVSLEKAHII